MILTFPTELGQLKKKKLTATNYYVKSRTRLTYDRRVLFQKEFQR